MAIVELGKAAAAQRAGVPQSAPEAPGEENAIIDVDTAFLVYRLPTGEVLVDTDINANIVPARAPHPHDILGMVAAASGDVSIMAHAPYIASTVIQEQMNVARGIQEQRQMQAAAAAVEASKRTSR